MDLYILLRVRMSEQSEFRTLEYKGPDREPRIHNTRYSTEYIYIPCAAVMPGYRLPRPNEHLYATCNQNDVNAGYMMMTITIPQKYKFLLEKPVIIHVSYVNKNLEMLYEIRALEHEVG